MFLYIGLLDIYETALKKTALKNSFNDKNLKLYMKIEKTLEVLDEM